MPVANRYETVTAFDGGTFEAYCAVPEGEGPWPGLVLFQEIFGVNDNMRGLAEKTAAAGYLALVPDMFWRIEPRFERKDESGLADGMTMVQQFDWERGGADIASTLGHLRAMPDCNGRAGGVGFCFGGVLAYLFAATSRPDGQGPDAAVSYYGSGVHGLLDFARKIECPIMFHYNPGPVHPRRADRQGRSGHDRPPRPGVPPLRRRPRLLELGRPVDVRPARRRRRARTLDFFSRHLRG